MTTLHAATANSVGLNLSLMCREPVFTSRSAQETQRLMGQALVEHELDWPKGGVDTAFYRGQVASCELYALRYGGQVEIRPRPFEDFVLVQMPLRGSATLESDGMGYGVSPGEVAILSPREQARVVWEEGCEQLILKLPRTLLAAGQRALGDDLPEGFDLAPVSRLQRPLAIRWFRLVSELLEHLPEGEAGATPSRWLQHLEQSLPLFLLSHCGAAQEPSPAPRLPARQLQKIDSCMREHLAQGISLSELAVAAGVSIRSLNTLCQREYGQSPMDRLRGLRLEAAREFLLARPHCSVTEVALEFGFGHVGRFANYYRQRFGELPKQTVKSQV
ncbi:AraC family transcriptional regulator [Pseudomonas sp. SDO55104_S430]